MPHSHERDEIVAFVTAPNEDEALRIARRLVEGRLAACVNIVRNIRSIYAWQGSVEDEAEVLLIAKSTKALFGELSQTVKELHSYDVPEVIALPIVDGSEAYLQWLQSSTK